jgi:hypothetical protein
VKLKGVAVAVLAIGSLLIGVSTVGAATKSGDPAQVAAAVERSITIQSIPSNLTPSLSLFSTPSAAANNDGGGLMHACDPYRHAAQLKHPVACFGGNLKASKTVVLVGDSNAGNWAPALAIGLAATKYRLAVFWYPGCGPSDMDYTHQHRVGGTTPAHCNEWHQNLPGVIRSLHPVAVIAVAAAWRSDTGTAGAEWVAGMKKLYERATLGSPSTLRILLGTSPSFSEHVPTCLMANTDPQACAVPDTPGSIYGGYLAQDQLIATTANATLIPVDPWLCYDGSCSPIIGKYLVYVDSDHMSTVYSQYASQVVTDAVVAVLKGA